MVETEGSKSELVALSDLIQIEMVRYQSRIRLSAGLFSLVCANCSGSFSEDSLIFLDISSCNFKFRFRARQFS